MAIIGIGIDIVEVPRVSRALCRWGERFVQRILREDEMDPRVMDARFVASRFAAKEAAVKALGQGFAGGVTFKDIGVYSGPGGGPVLKLYGRAREIGREKGVDSMFLSLSHERGVACAVVVFEGKTKGGEDEVHD